MEDWRIGSLLEFLYSLWTTIGVETLLRTTPPSRQGGASGKSLGTCTLLIDRLGTGRSALKQYMPIWVLGPNGYFSREAGNTLENTWWRNWQAGSPRLLWQLLHQLLHQRQWERFSSCIEKSFPKIITHTPTYTHIHHIHSHTLTHPCKNKLTHPCKNKLTHLHSHTHATCTLTQPLIMLRYLYTEGQSRRAPVTATAWKDKIVNFLSMTTQPMTTQPTAIGSADVPSYNQHGVDRGDQLRGYYRKFLFVWCSFVWCSHPKLNIKEFRGLESHRIILQSEVVMVVRLFLSNFPVNT